MVQSDEETSLSESPNISGTSEEESGSSNRLKRERVSVVDHDQFLEVRFILSEKFAHLANNVPSSDLTISEPDSYSSQEQNQDVELPMDQPNAPGELPFTPPPTNPPSGVPPQLIFKIPKDARWVERELKYHGS
ncbi:MAG: hypothetical protein L6R42_001095 [Xanthoria sp. 1 TBL-2021]|nr:MAG: hypothetical protein L6R42_001095 [Xanthoria sp. 1 TBL-2021]